MKLQIQAIRFDADEKLLAFIQQKLDKLDTFYDRIINGEVFLKLGNKETNKIHTKVIDVKLFVPGATLFVSEKGTTFEEATDLAIDTLKMKVKRYKNKKNNSKAVRPEVVDEEVELIEE